jgi:hypothetical protein
VAWKPSSVLREALLAGKRQEEDDRLVERYMAGPGRGHDPQPLINFVRHGPSAGGRRNGSGYCKLGSAIPRRLH